MWNMKASELRIGKVEEIELEVTKKDDERRVKSYYGDHRVCDAVGKDETGQVSLALWNDEIDGVKVGTRIRITNGYVKEWRGELQLSAGKYGKLEAID
jgi:OB-fold nucleic acid binding domain.